MATKTLDITKEHCPMTFVKTKIELSKLQSGDILEVLPGLTQTFALKIVPVLLILCYFIPCLILLYEGLKLCFTFRSPSWHPGLVMTILWIIVIIALCIVVGMSFLPLFTA